MIGRLLLIVAAGGALGLVVAAYVPHGNFAPSRPDPGIGVGDGRDGAAADPQDGVYPPPDQADTDALAPYPSTHGDQADAGGRADYGDGNGTAGGYDRDDRALADNAAPGERLSDDGLSDDRSADDGLADDDADGARRSGGNDRSGTRDAIVPDRNDAAAQQAARAADDVKAAEAAPARVH